MYHPTGSVLSVCCVKVLPFTFLCAVFTVCKCSFLLFTGSIISSLVICFTHLMESVLKSPTGFWTTTCQSELNFQTFQLPKNFGSRPCEL